MKLLRIALLSLLPLSCLADDAVPTVLNFESFGDVQVYGDPARMGPVAIVLNDASVPVDMRVQIAKQAAARGALIALVDLDHYFKAIAAKPDSCAYHSWEFEKLSKFIQKTLARPNYQPPLLVGFGTGAGLAYTTVTEAPRGTFAGLFTSGLCPDMRVPKKLCANEDETWEEDDNANQISLKALDKSSEPWVALPTSRAQCPATASAEFFSDVDGAKVLPVSTASWSTGPWAAQVSEAIWHEMLDKPQPRVADELGDLPVVEQRAEKATNKTLAVVVTGDGGWAGIDREVADQLNAAGMDVVGFNSLQFFWKKRTPEETAQAISRVISHYTKSWQPDGVLLVGYSFGADIMPFVVHRLPKDDAAEIKAVALLAPGLTTQFEFRVSEWLGLDEDTGAYRIVPEILAMPKIPVICIYGEEETDEAACPKLASSQVKVVKTSGGHHFDGDYDALAHRIIELLPRR
ncbi:MAG: virulence factor family protein [Rhodospirillaceae bacterium]|nr:virulence factor family protein [Rhodospirillaceae bacterium]